MDDIRLQLAREESRAIVQGAPRRHDVSESSFILTGLEIEEQQ